MVCIFQKSAKAAQKRRIRTMDGECLDCPPKGARRRRSGGGPEGGELVSPSTPTSTSTRWAMLNFMPCHAWHGRGLDEGPAAAIRGIIGCREAMYGEFWKITIFVHQQ
jgi:hypothetical protein